MGAAEQGEGHGSSGHRPIVKAAVSLASCFQTEDVGTGLALAAPPVLLSLAPLLVGRARRGVVGSSRYAKTLRESVRQAAADGQLRAVFISENRGWRRTTWRR